jgi:hypothetical protein
MMICFSVSCLALILHLLLIFRLIFQVMIESWFCFYQYLKLEYFAQMRVTGFNCRFLEIQIASTLNEGTLFFVFSSAENDD